mmetsp:Transcript_9178/g.10605  ORF Transcript_9178/g.10605 Transcript_9178/m.10605 type:complete len:584 (+) Transcript_9178:130-1881(+)|eukprot:CAMPEP_0197849616 /NCGR_PEP_ID=MMETSP1438-20131217/12693_1 /TAXON_ID=1461541 /ORGANISM="Pterosperma sp., Strain CCMP1384" /LENGTH=583 /DNA_ID=CAMNT_0043462391 /DNA_START=124 /DNA_END=1875 /DNA_ORIENTATION=+
MSISWRGPLALVLCCVLTSNALAQTTIYSLHGSGTTNPSKFFWKLMDTMEEQAKVPLYMTYRAVGSSTGQYEFVGVDNNYVPYNDFGAGDIPLTQTYYDELVSKGIEMVHIPFALGAIGFFHSVPNAPEGRLNLDSCTLSKIFQRIIKTWDHPDIKALNPLLDVPANQEINVVHRQEGSSSTAGTAQYLKTANHGATDSSCEWKLNTGSTVNWPEDTTIGQGSDGVAAEIVKTEYSIGYIDAGHAHALGLQEIELKNKDGIYLNTNEAIIGDAAAEALKAGNLPTLGSSSWADVNLYNMAGPDTWPITMMSYFYLRKNLTDIGDSGSLLKTFVERILSGPGQDLATEFMFAKLPDQLIEYNKETLSSVILAPDAAQWEEEISTRKGPGAGEFVLSSKRRSYAEYERTLLKDYIDTLESEVQQLQSKLKEVQAEVTIFKSDAETSIAEAIARSGIISDRQNSLQETVERYHAEEMEISLEDARTDVMVEIERKLENVSEQVDALKSSNLGVNTSLATAPEDKKVENDVDVKEANDDDNKDKGPALAIGIVACVLGTFALILSVYNTITVKNGPTQKELTQMEKI